jgi:hypothetical protein
MQGTANIIQKVNWSEAPVQKVSWSEALANNILQVCTLNMNTGTCALCSHTFQLFCPYQGWS